MAQIRGSIENNDSYLYKKDTYTPDDKSLALDDETATTEDIAIPDISEEEIPEHLKDEKKIETI